MLSAFEEEVVHEAWQNTPSVFHFFNSSETLAGMYESVDATHSCTISGTTVIHQTYVPITQFFMSYVFKALFLRKWTVKSPAFY